VLAGTVTTFVDFKHEITVRINYDVPILGPLLLVIVPVIVAVYTPGTAGFDHDIAMVYKSIVINDVLCPLSAVTVDV
jgi:hypothetical protein